MEASAQENDEGVWFQDEVRDERIHLMLHDALEVKFEKDPNADDEAEENVNAFNWDLIEFSSEFLQIKLDFENPEAIGSFQ